MMAREEHPREDLMREAVALTRRIELCVEGESAPVVIGFRRDGSASVYFGDDPVVQFNRQGELRRGYRGGRLIKAERGRLVSLTRVRTATETQLVRHELTAAETAQYLEEVAGHLTRLREFLKSGRATVLRQVPQDEPVLIAAEEWLGRLSAPLMVAHAPSAR